jgi:glycosyltransferase involved in cell wall biosynthesis
VYSSAAVGDFSYACSETPLRNRLLFLLGIRLADEVVVQTDEQVELCRRAFGREPVRIRSVAEPAPQRVKEPEAFLWVGRLVPEKRPLAFLELARAVPEATFWMVPLRFPGTESMLHDVETAAARLPNVRILDQQPRAELASLIERSVAVVNTSPTEGTSNVVLEAWSRGVPALALEHDPDGAIQQHDLGGFAHGSDTRLAELTRQMWQTRSALGEVAERCRRFVQREHSPEAVARQWMRLLESPPGSVAASPRRRWV